MTLRQRTLILLIAIDHLALALITLGNCHRGETISAASWSLEQSNKPIGRVLRPLIDWLFTWIEVDHCHVSYEAEKHIYRSPT